MRLLVLILIVAGALVAAAPAAERPVGMHDPGWDDTAYTWSPNGARILYHREWEPAKDPPDYGYGIVGKNGLPARLLGKTFDESSEIQAAWSPDSAHLVFARIAGYGDGPLDVFLAGPEGQAQRNVTNTEDLSEFDARWSPDGSQLVFSRRDDESLGDPDLWL